MDRESDGKRTTGWLEEPCVALIEHDRGITQLCIQQCIVNEVVTRSAMPATFISRLLLCNNSVIIIIILDGIFAVLYFLVRKKIFPM